MKNLLIQVVLLALILFFSSCASYEELLNFNETPKLTSNATEIVNFKPLQIQPSDVLRIRVSSTDPSTIAAFTLSNSAENDLSSAGYDEYLVNAEGFIDFPTLGKIEVNGLQVENIKALISQKLSTYFKVLPIIQVSLINFKVIVNGEVNQPGSFQVANGRLTIIEAITLAGDFTNFSNRDSILIIREESGFRNFGYIDFTSAELFSSPYFYLQQNDVIYVKPTKIKVGTVSDPSAKILPWVSAAVSVILLLIALRRN